MATYELLNSYTVSGSASSVSFSSIPSTYTDFIVKGSVRSNRADGSDWITISFSSGGSYTQRTLIGDGGSVISDSSAPTGMVTTANGATGNVYGVFELYFPNYAVTQIKSYSLDSVSENNGNTAYQQFFAGQGSGTGAVSSITFTPQYGTAWMDKSTFYLYGIKKS